MRQIAVRREDDEALAVFVESAGAEKAILRELARQHGEDGVRIVRIIVRANETARLVHRERDARLRRSAHRFSLRGDAIFAGDNFLAEFRDGAIHPHLPLRDQGFRRAPGTNAGIGEVFLQANRFGG